jgi:hypothetical protein
MLNDPKWVRFAGTNAKFSEGPVVSGIPTLGVGAYRCNNPKCEVPHMTIACIDQEGREISVLLSPDTGAEIAKTIVQKLGEVGHHLFALAGMRCMTLVNELATMTDIEADFLDGHGLKDAARAMLGTDPVVIGQVLPRRYSEEDRLRAIAAVQVEQVQGPNTADSIVDIVAEALGLRLGGA